ncbi:MAG: PQQ-binding-like beta-propeller repeat protein [Phycisphaerales bacterium]
MPAPAFTVSTLTHARGTTRVAATLLAAWIGGTTLGAAPAPHPQQQTTTPAISDSPTAQTLFDDVRTQSRENPAESARLARRLLDEYGNRVVRVGAESEDLFNSVSEETERFLLANPAVLERFRDMESRAAERMLREEGPAVTAARRRLTPAGLSASLALAERALRADQPAEAVAILGQVASHPDLQSADAAAAHATLDMMARRRLGDAAGFAAAEARLAAIAGLDPARVAGARAAAERTEASRATLRGRSPFDAAPDGGNPDETWREIWTLDLEQSLFRRTYASAFAPRAARDADRVRSDANLMTAVPTVLGNRIFICEGHRIRAIDVDSRDEQWSRELGSVGMERGTGAVADLSAIAADDGVVVVYEGHALPTQRTGNARVWCLDPATGATLWNAVVDGLEGREELTGLFPVGRPVLAADVVVIAARKPTQRLEQVDWLLALDRRDGRLRWATSVAGAPANRSSIGRKHAGLATDGSVVVDATPLGVVMSVRASDGSIEWLRRFPVPLRDPRYFAEPWEASAPAIVGDRVIAIAPDELEVVALDRITGRLLEARPIGPDTLWTSPNYLLAATAADGTPIVLAVGSNVAAFDARDLTKRLWTLAESTRGIEPPRVATTNRHGIRGRVSISGQYVVVPGVEEILLLDLASGRVNARVPSERPSNPLLLPDRLVTAGDDKLRVVMPSERAEGMLRARLAQTPDDPSAAIALLELAEATGRPTVALDAARAAEQAFSRGRGSESLRGELLDQLVHLASRHAEHGDAAFEIVTRICTTPELRVRGELARGEYLRSAGRPQEAIACMRAIAADTELSMQLVGPVEAVRRQVRGEVLARLGQLTSRDRELAATIENDAQAALADLGAQPDALALTGLVRSHPRTQAAVDAVVLAGQRGLDPDGALRRAAMLDNLIPPARVDLLDTLRAQAATGDAPRFAAAAVNDRIAALLHGSGIARPDLELPSISTPKLGVTAVSGLDLRARLPRETLACRASRDRSLVLGLLEGALVRMSGPELAMQWRLRLDDREPDLLWARGRAVLWQHLPKGEDGALVVDPAQGAIIWASPKPSELWPAEPNRDGAQGADGAAGADAEASPFINAPGRPGQDGRFQNGARFAGTMPSLVLPVCDGDSLVLVRRNGDLARVGVMDERPTAQLARGVLDLVVCEDLRDGVLTIGGRVNEGDSSRPVVQLLDARTLAPLHRIEPIARSEVKWAFTTALGEVFIGTATGTEMWVIGADNRPLPALVSRLTESSDTNGPILLGAHLFTADSSSRPTLTPLYAGDPRTIEYADAANARQLRDLIELPEGLLLQADDRFTLVGPSGEVIGEDSNSREANLAFAIPVAGGLLQLLALPIDQDARTRAQISCVIERLSPAQGLRNEGAAFEVKVRDSRISRVLAVDGWLLLSNAQGTVAIAMPESASDAAPATPPSATPATAPSPAPSPAPSSDAAKIPASTPSGTP